MKVSDEIKSKYHSSIMRGISIAFAIPFSSEKNPHDHPFPITLVNI